MPINRRHLLRTGTLALGAGTPLMNTGLAAATPRVAAAEAGAVAADGVAADAFLRLKPGSIVPRGWLAGQLRLQLDGLCGRLTEKSHFLDFATSGWVHPENGAWEELPYWLRGYVPLAVATRDTAALDRARRWIDAILTTQQSDGFFGPRALRTALNGGPDFWPFLPLLQALRTFEEFTGDTRVVPFLTRFLRYMNTQGKGAFDTSWVSQRWGDCMDIALWLYRRTPEPFLLDLVDKMHAWGADWTGALPNAHNVNIAQGFREPAQYAQRSGSAEHTRASYRTYTELLAAHGQFAGGGFAGDENIRPGFGDPRQGFETCGVVEFMASHELLTRVTGDPLWADRCEELAFNMLPASLDPDGKGVHYVTSANSVDLDNSRKTQGQFQNGFAMQSFQPGIDQYRCCPHNYGMGWPYFAEELWLGTPDGGLAAAMYAACQVTTEVAGGTSVTVTETTDYPFGETVDFVVSTPRSVSFPLLLRIPGWCAAPRLQINGQSVPARSGPAFVRVDRTWADGDRVSLRLPQSTTVHTWPGNRDSVSVSHGPLTYALRIGERYVRYGGDTTFPEYEVHATTPWNYGLVSGGNLVVRRASGPVAANPFTQSATPVSITADARRVPEWIADDEHVVAPLQQSPARSAGAVEQVTLIPMGAARLRIASFPTASPDGTPWQPEATYRRIRNKHSGKVLAVDGMSTENSAHVVQFDNSGTGDHAWQVVGRGDGWSLIRNGHSGKVLGVDGMSTQNSAHVVQFEDNGTDDHLWQFVDAGSGWFLIRNKHSGKVLGVDGMSTQNSAHVVQFEDNGTDDHLWQFV
ncbi:RICIN domain-containing protein [Streptomyces sp. NPDC057621]|uniref:RICIN domain-containing protein n=1 Tax=Streptomyces sp. NPDC057621 TaxID=3346186 RepID=UPI0036A32162